MLNKITGIALIFLSSTAFGADMKQAPAVQEAIRIIKEMNCKPWTGVMIKAKMVAKSELDDNAFVVPMFCDKEPQALVAAQKYGKTFVSKERYKVVSTIKFDGKKISGMATRIGESKATPYLIEAFQ